MKIKHKALRNLLDEKFDQALLKPFHIVNIGVDIETYTIYVSPTEKKQVPMLLCTYCPEEAIFNHDFWGVQCITDFIQFVRTLVEIVTIVPTVYTLWTFNGAKFDCLYMLQPLYDQFGSQVEFYGKELDIKMLKVKNVYFKDIYLISPTGSLKK